MSKILQSTTNALADFFNPRILFFCLALPLFAMLLGLCGLLLVWTPGTEFFSGWLAGDWLQSWWPSGPAWLGSGIATFLLLLLLLPLSYVVILILTAIFLVPRIQSFLLGGRFADLARRPGGSVRGAIWNSVKYGLIYLVLFMLTLPLWLIPLGGWVVPALLNAWLTKKILPYEILQDVASNEEREEIRSFNRGNFLLLALTVGFFSAIPFLSLFIPVLASLAFGDYCFRRLREARNSALPVN
jgi:hypothetical protein